MDAITGVERSAALFANREDGSTHPLRQALPSVVGYAKFSPIPQWMCVEVRPFFVTTGTSFP